MFPSDQKPPTDLHVRRLEQQLAAARAASDAAWEDGYRTGRGDSNLDIPNELTMALRHGSAQEHRTIAIDDDHVTMILAQAGAGHPREHLEARAWASIQAIHRRIVSEARPGVAYLRHVEMPRPIAAVIWRSGDDVAVAVNRVVSRAHLRAVLRSRSIRVTGWTLAAIVGWAIGRQLVRGAPLAAAVAVTAAVTAVAMPHITHAGPRPHTGPRPAVTAPGPLAHGPVTRKPAAPPVRKARPGGSASPTPGAEGPLAASPPASPSAGSSSSSGSTRPPKPTKRPRPEPKPQHPAHGHQKCLPGILQLIDRLVCRH